MSDMSRLERQLGKVARALEAQTAAINALVESNRQIVELALAAGPDEQDDDRPTHDMAGNPINPG